MKEDFEIGSIEKVTPTDVTIKNSDGTKTIAPSTMLSKDENGNLVLNKAAIPGAPQPGQPAPQQKPDSDAPQAGQKISMVKDGVNEVKQDYNFTADNIKELERINNLDVLKSQAIDLISTSSQRSMKPEKIEWFKNAISSKTNKLEIIKLMYDLLLAGEGHMVIGSRNSTRANSYRSRFEDIERIRSLSGLK